MSGEDTADAAVGHATTETHSWTIACSGIHKFDGFGANDNCSDENGLPNHPEHKLLPAKKGEELIQIMRGFTYGAEDGDEYCSSTYEDSSTEGVSSEWLSKE